MVVAKQVNVLVKHMTYQSKRANRTFKVKPPQLGPPKGFQPIRNQSLNKEMNVQTSRKLSCF